MAAMPVYEFECEQCGERFEELTSSDTRSLACPNCSSDPNASPALAGLARGRQPRGAGVRSDESRRRDREAARGERLAEQEQAGEGGSLDGVNGRGAA